MNEYRCTRRKPYPKGTPGFDDASARQGYYIRATSEKQALYQMAEKFPGEAAIGFDVTLWCENVDRKPCRQAEDPPPEAEGDVNQYQRSKSRSYIFDWLQAEQSINEPGDPHTIQRFVYDAARVKTEDDWRRLNNDAHGLLERMQDDTGISLLINAICVATHEVRRYYRKGDRNAILCQQRNGSMMLAEYTRK